VTDVDRERVAQLGGVLLVEVDLIRRSVESERHRLGRLGTVEVVLENDVDLLRHHNSFTRRGAIFLAANYDTRFPLPE